MGSKKKYKSADDDRMQANENMNGERPKAEAWRPMHSRYVQNTQSTEISGSLLLDRADERNQLPDEFVRKSTSIWKISQHDEQQLRKELSMVAQDNDAKHGERQEAAYQKGQYCLRQLGECMDDLLQLIRPCPLQDTKHSMSMKGHTSEQNMTTVEEGYNSADP